MTERFATSHFGGRMMNAAHFLNYETIRKYQNDAQNSQTINDANKRQIKPVDRWKALRALTEARDHYQISHRTIAVLEALLSFYPDKMLDPSNQLIVFPSNYELSMRLRGMSAPTIRRHLASLISLGFLMRKDSPNGKRFVRRDSDGEIAMAFGFDLAPFVFKSEEIENQAHFAREFARKKQELRFTITIHLRDISKTVQAALVEQRDGGWETLLARLQSLSGRVERNGTIENLSIREQALAELRADAESLYISTLSEQEMSANDIKNERHIQNSHIDSLDYKTQREKPVYETPQTIISSVKTNSHTTEPQKLAQTLRSCPQIQSYAAHGIHNWSDLINTAGHIRSMLGISSSAWKNACEIMGEATAAVTIAVILERSETIHSAGGYLRKLTQRAQMGQYSIKPVLKALNKTKH